MCLFDLNEVILLRASVVAINYDVIAVFYLLVIKRGLTDSIHCAEVMLL